MNKTLFQLSLVSVCVLVAGCSTKPPQKVTDSLMGRFPGAKVVATDKERENGVVIYDFELMQDGKKYEADIKGDGTIVEIEKQVDPKDVPAAVTAAVLKEYPMSSIKGVMEVDLVNGKEEKPDHYEVTVLTGGRRTIEVTIGLDGKDLKEEVE